MIESEDVLKIFIFSAVSLLLFNYPKNIIINFHLQINKNSLLSSFNLFYEKKDTSFISLEKDPIVNFTPSSCYCKDYSANTNEISCDCTRVQFSDNIYASADPSNVNYIRAWYDISATCQGTEALYCYDITKNVNNNSQVLSNLQIAVNYTGDDPALADGLYVDMVYIQVDYTSDQIPPTWGNQSQSISTPGVGAKVILSAYWADNAALDYAWLATNETGVWENKTSIYLIGFGKALSGWSNFTWQNSSIPAGTIVAWRIYANDSAGNENVTDIMTFEVKPTYLLVNLTFPSPLTYTERNPYLVSQNSTFWINTSVKCYSEGKGDCGLVLASPRYNKTGTEPNEIANISEGVPFYAIAPGKFKRLIVIDNTQNSNSLTDYQVLIVLDTQTLISQGKMRSDCGDIRFTDSDGVTLLNYWIESGCNTTSTKIWVKVPFISASSTKTIYIYYGNPSAKSLSNATTTFDYFFSFEGSFEGWTPSKYETRTTYATNDPTITTEWKYDGSYSVKLRIGGDYSDVGAYSQISRMFSFSTNVKLDFAYRLYAEPSDFDGGYARFTVLVDGNVVYDSGPIGGYGYDSGTLFYSLSIPSGLHTIVFKLIEDSSPEGWTSRRYAYIDKVSIRKHASPEPTTSVGDEDNRAVISCGVLISNEMCEVSWLVNATGNINSVWTVNVNFTSSFEAIPKNYTSKVYIKIVPLTKNFKLSIYNSTFQLNPEAWVDLLDKDYNLMYKFQGMHEQPLEYNQNYSLRISQFITSSTISVLIHHINVTKDLNLMAQIVKNYQGYKPSWISNLTAVFAFNDTDLDYSYATIYIPKEGINVNRIMHCLDWDFYSANCSKWDIQPLSFYNAQENSTHIWFNVTKFEAYAAGYAALPYLEVSIISPNPLAINYVVQNSTFWINTSVTCKNADCGLIYAIPRYNASSPDPDTTISNSSNAIPFYVIGNVEQSCYLLQDQSCNVRWLVNATGDINTYWKVGVLFYNSLQNHTENATIEIIGCTVDFSLTFSTVDFGEVLPNTYGNPAIYNNFYYYNITINPGSCNLNLYINATDLVNNTFNYVINVGNLSYNTENNYLSAKRLSYQEQLIAQNLFPNAVLTLFFWLDVPPTFFGKYYGKIFIKGTIA